ncbi:hypothetical protein [Flavobacterium rhizosphaerae]|uniref:Mor transcription activator family protein n=1 Tax=Flavobacterium rhizosphaerae TaxID=3163298 RepID=A0ABW8Z1T2_9FLAO
MNRYETILSLGEDFMKLMAKSLIPVHILDWKVYYEAYIKEMEYQNKHFKKPRKSEATATVAAHYNISERTVYNIIAFMEG